MQEQFPGDNTGRSGRWQQCNTAIYYMILQYWIAVPYNTGTYDLILNKAMLEYITPHGVITSRCVPRALQGICNAGTLWWCRQYSYLWSMTAQPSFLGQCGRSALNSNLLHIWTLLLRNVGRPQKKATLHWSSARLLSFAVLGRKKETAPVYWGETIVTTADQPVLPPPPSHTPPTTF